MALPRLFRKLGASGRHCLSRALAGANAIRSASTSEYGPSGVELGLQREGLAKPGHRPALAARRSCSSSSNVPEHPSCCLVPSDHRAVRKDMPSFGQGCLAHRAGDRIGLRRRYLRGSTQYHATPSFFRFWCAVSAKKRLGTVSRSHGRAGPSDERSCPASLPRPCQRPSCS